MNEIRHRIKALRLELLKRDLDALYIPGTDPHSGEYLAPHWHTRAFISGYTGSYGIVIITQEDAGLWTDPRYFIQAQGQLKGTGIKMYKLKIPGAITPESWLSKKMTFGSKVGFEPETMMVSSYRILTSYLNNYGINLIETEGIFNKIWKDRPEIPINKIFELSTCYTGFSRKKKRELVLDKMKEYNADLQIITTSDELAWIFNLRGSDVPYNPVFIGYGVIGHNESVLFIDKIKVPTEIKVVFEREKIKILDYDKFFLWLGTIRYKKVLIDPETTNLAAFKSLISSDNKIIEGTSAIALLKSVKNQTELRGFTEVMKRDGIALLESLFWLKKNVDKGLVTEYLFGRKLAEFRSHQEGYHGESFAPIVGYRNHGAIVHLNVSREEAYTLYPEGILLFDSGAHYLYGTTDITRTVAIGIPSDQQKIDFTLVLKGLIALTVAKFPEGTKGCNLDILARRALWQQGLNYGHGTGHGVGHFLNVHEGPASIRQELNENYIKPGMVFSNEPGLYREGEYGIRIENLIVCVEKEKTEFGNFLGFNTLTLFPIDISLINKELLSCDERRWINSYHHRVKKELAPLVRNELDDYLEELTCEI